MTGSVDVTESVDWHRARDLSFAAGTALPHDVVSLPEAIGRRLAADVTSLIDVPHYASSAMDGWAVSGAPPWRILAAATGDRVATLRPGEAVPILTGSLVPRGTHGILRSEHGDRSTDGAALAPNTHARPGEPRRDLHVRPRGEEARAGDVLFPAGALLTPGHVAVLAACGHDDVAVRRRPRVSLVLTGDEVVTAGIPAPGRVRDSFGPSLPSTLTCLGADVVSVRHIGDDRDLLRAALAAGVGECDVLITTGGTGGSNADHLRAALGALGAQIVVSGVRMRPGGPSLLARLADERVLVGLPGNPLAAMMGVLTLVAPVLESLLGAPLTPLGRTTPNERVPGAEGRVSLVPFERDGTRARPTRWRGSGMLRGLAAADGVLVCPAGGAEADQEVPTLRLPWTRN
jgi:molybdopterin molybdotransferase